MEKLNEIPYFLRGVVKLVNLSDYVLIKMKISDFFPNLESYCSNSF